MLGRRVHTYIPSASTKSLSNLIMKVTASGEANQPPSSPSHRHRLRKVTASTIIDNEDFIAGKEDPVINYLGFDSSGGNQESFKSSLIKKEKSSTSSDLSASSHHIIYEINRTTSVTTTGGVKSSDTPRTCRRRYQSYAEKVAASSYDQSEYEELLRVKKNRRNDEKKVGFTGYTTTTDSLSNVLNAFERESFMLNDEHDLLVSFDASEDSINQFIEREARVYREAKLYQDIEAELIETVGVIERIGQNRGGGDWRHSVIQINEADRINMVNACALELDALNRTSSKQQSTKDRQNSLKVRKKQSSLREKLRRPFRQRNKSVSKTINEASDEDCDYKSRENTPVVKRANFGGLKSPKLIRNTPSFTGDTSNANKRKSPKLKSRFQTNIKRHGDQGSSKPIESTRQLTKAVLMSPSEDHDDVFKQEPQRHESSSSNSSCFSEEAVDRTVTVSPHPTQTTKEEFTTRVTFKHSHKMNQKSKSPSIIRRLRNSSDKTKGDLNQTGHKLKPEESITRKDNELSDKAINKSDNKGVTKSRSFNLGKAFPNFTKKQSKNAEVVPKTTVTVSSNEDCTSMNDKPHPGRQQPAEVVYQSTPTHVKIDENHTQKDDQSIKKIANMTNVSDDINLNVSTARADEQPTGAFLDIDLSVGYEKETIIGEVINEKASIDSFLQISSGNNDSLAGSTAGLGYAKSCQLSSTTKSSSETMNFGKSLNSTMTNGGSFDSTTETDQQSFKTVTLTIGKSLSSTMASIGASFDSTTTTATTNSVSEGSEFDIIDKNDPALLLHQHRDKQMEEKGYKNDMDLSSLIDFANVLTSCKP